MNAFPAQPLSLRRERPLISIVVPVFNEEENVMVFHDAVSRAVQGEAPRYDFEFLFTDNHSTDHTFGILSDLVRADPRVRVIRFSRNFGFQKSIYAAYMHARGDAAVQLDCDLQDPPSLIPVFLRYWEEGSAVVYGVRRSRREGWGITILRRIFYWGINKLSENELPRDAGDFRLIDRRIIEELRLLRDTNIYIRGRIATMGFTQTPVPYDRDARRAGQSKFNATRLMMLAIDGVVSHSVVPLRFATGLGLLTLASSVVMTIIYLVAYLAYGFEWPRGFATIVVLMLVQLGLLSTLLGIIGEYLARMYDQLKMSPDVIIERVIDNQGTVGATTTESRQTVSSGAAPAKSLFDYGRAVRPA